MRSILKTPTVAAILSLLVPGLGQVAMGKPRRGLIVFIPTGALFLAVAALVVFNRRALTDMVTSPWLSSLALLAAVHGLYRAWAIVDAYMSVDRTPPRGLPGRRARRPNPLTSRIGVPVLMTALVCILGMHLWFGMAVVSTASGVSCMFQQGGPCDLANGGNYGDPGVGDLVVDPDTLETGQPVAVGTPYPGWKASIDVNIRSGAGVSFPIMAGITAGTILTGEVVTGGTYTTCGGSSNEWIKIDEGQPLAGGYAARACFTQTMIQPATPAPNATMQPIVYPQTTLPPAAGVATHWASDGYLNVLLVGADSGGGRADMRTDTMMLLQVKIATGQAALYGIPRNLFNVPMPPQWQNAWECHCFFGYYGSAASGGNYMLNALWQWGAWRARDKFPGTGATTDFERGFKVLEATIGQLMGVQVDGVVYINLLGFVKLIDDLGGLNIFVPYAVVDSRMPRPDGAGTYVLNIQPGQQHFDGVTALAYVRSRHQADDTQRMDRQQAVIKAIRAEFNPCQILPRVPSLMNDLGGMIWTDLPQEDAPRLAALAQAVAGSNLQTFSFTPQKGYPEYVTPAEVAQIHNVVAHGLDNAPKGGSGGGGGGGGGGGINLSC